MCEREISGGGSQLDPGANLANTTFDLDAEFRSGGTKLGQVGVEWSPVCLWFSKGDKIMRPFRRGWG